MGYSGAEQTLKNPSAGTMGPGSGLGNEAGDTFCRKFTAASQPHQCCFWHGIGPGEGLITLSF
jgi:hypothetical protein